MASDSALSDGSIALRPFRAEDTRRVYEAVQESLDEVTPWIPALHAGVTVEEIGAWIASQPQLRADGAAHNFAIVDARDDAFIGGCGLTQINYSHRFANLYYWVRTARAGQGAASAATLLLAHFGLSSLGLQRIEIVVATGNHASKRAAEKAGAKYEGLLRNRLQTHGVSYDAFMFSLVPGDL